MCEISCCLCRRLSRERILDVVQPAKEFAAYPAGLSMDSDSDEAEKLQPPEAEEVGNSCCLSGCSWRLRSWQAVSESESHSDEPEICSHPMARM